MLEVDRTKAQPISRAAVGWALVGFGGSFAVAGGYVFYMFFLPGRGRPLQAFRLDHPVLPVIVPMILIGVVLLIVGSRLKRQGRAPGPAKPLVLSEHEAEKYGSPPSRG
ncbi:hypothetical protein [Phenylobacterium sp.]|jgi:hypothetical protein|uniref:hypothetical protein n=1 Tax=Phenylobacterium sp. TaxID=1871053 RepID=UPI002F92982B